MKKITLFAFIITFSLNLFARNTESSAGQKGKSD